MPARIARRDMVSSTVQFLQDQAELLPEIAEHVAAAQPRTGCVFQLRRSRRPPHEAESVVDRAR